MAHANFVVFEDGGDLRAGTIRAETDASLQIDTATGKRVKIKASQVLLRFATPQPEDILSAAGLQAKEIDIDFLWECAPQDEFAFTDLAREYVGHEPTAVQASAVLLCLQGAPVYFQRKGKGRFRPAAPETLRLALAALERRRQQEQQREAWVQELRAGRLPAPIAAVGARLVIRPDRNTNEVKALEAAADLEHCSSLRLLLRLGGLPSAYDWHVAAFLDRAFPRGERFRVGLSYEPTRFDELPMGPDCAFSIDDSATTEIDDAFSVRVDGDDWLIGVHIAAPALSLVRDHELDVVARERLSTVYAPGLKYTMLPSAWIDAFSLAQGATVPALSLYLVVNPQTLQVSRSYTRVERITVAANLRYDLIEHLIQEDQLDQGELPLPFGQELCRLWQFSGALRRVREEQRGRPEPKGRQEISLVLDGEGSEARVERRIRQRDAPLDRIVSELMICTNQQWGTWLESLGFVGIYRSQSMGRVRMSTTPAPHEGLGVARYAWCTSPLRRYVDLFNQRQLIAAALGHSAPYVKGDADVFAIVSAFEGAYALYAEFQERMERYWSLRWLVQERVQLTTARVQRGDILRLEDLPMTVRLAAAEGMARGQRASLEILGIDDIDLSVEIRLNQWLDDIPSDAEPEPDPEDSDLADTATSPTPDVVGSSMP